MAKAIHPGYRARDKDVKSCCTLNAKLCKIKKRIQQRRDCPLWILDELDDLITRSDCLIGPLVEHRDELPKFMEV